MLRQAADMSDVLNISECPAVEKQLHLEELELVEYTARHLFVFRICPSLIWGSYAYNHADASDRHADAMLESRFQQTKVHLMTL